MDALYGFLKTILDFLVQIATLFLQLFIYVANFLIGFIQSLANSV